MTFLSAYSEKTYLTMQRTRKNYEKTIISNRYNSIKRKMEGIAKRYSAINAGDDNAPKVQDDPEYIALERQAEQMEPEKVMLEEDVKELEAQINSLTNIIKEGVKSSCGLTLTGGSS